MSIHQHVEEYEHHIIRLGLCNSCDQDHMLRSGSHNLKLYQSYITIIIYNNRNPTKNIPNSDPKFK